jgi:predicted RNase H-like nuclease (RuvC/YqgF family)
LQKKIAELESKNKKLLRKNVDLESLVQALEWQLEQMHENVDSEPPLS